jgi:hypothetical protein
MVGRGFAGESGTPSPDDNLLDLAVEEDAFAIVVLGVSGLPQFAGTAKPEKFASL